MKIAVTNEVLRFLDELVTILVEKEYFGFEESAEEYVNKLYDAIYDDLPTLTHHKTPKELEHYGKTMSK